MLAGVCRVQGDVQKGNSGVSNGKNIRKIRKKIGMLHIIYVQWGIAFRVHVRALYIYPKKEISLSLTKK